MHNLSARPLGASLGGVVTITRTVLVSVTFSLIFHVQQDITGAGASDHLFSSSRTHGRQQDELFEQFQYDFI